MSFRPYRPRTKSEPSLRPIFAGSERHRGAEAGLGGAEGGESDGEHLQTLPDQRTTQTVQGDSLDSDDKVVELWPIKQ